MNTFFQFIWLVIVVTILIFACSWADKDMHGWYPEMEQKASSPIQLR